MNYASRTVAYLRLSFVRAAHALAPSIYSPSTYSKHYSQLTALPFFTQQVLASTYASAADSALPPAQ
eukprot:20425-Eustigmatos_ZCMA.PRE.1